VPTAHELLCEASWADGDLDRAEQHLRRCLTTSPDRSGTTGLPDLTLAELLVERGTPAGLQEAAALLDAADLTRAITTPQLPRHPDVGLVHADATILAELRRLASP
jgi:hypothetical protein